MLRLIIFSILIFSAILAQDTVTVTNGEVVVTVDRTTGRFAIGGFDGTPFITGFPDDPTNTHVCIYMDGNTYCNEPGLGDMDFVLRDTASIHGNEISIVWNMGLSRAWEKFYALEEEDLEGFIYVEYLYYNDTPDSHLVGFLEYMDVCVGGNNNPAIEIPGDIVDCERSFMGTAIPAYWTLYEDYDDTLSTLAWGVPFGREEIYADMVAFTDLEFGAGITWNFTALGRAIENLVVLIRWNEVMTGPDQFYLTGHYYGSGYDSVAIAELFAKHPPMQILIGAPYPNPANSATNIEIEVLGHPQYVGLDIIAIDGKQVATLNAGECDAGKHVFRWDLCGRDGNPVPSGVYIAKFSTGRSVWSRSIFVIR